MQKHANASAVWVSLEMSDSTDLVLVIKDNGNVDSLKPRSLVDPIRYHHFGIAGMYEDADLVSGNLAINRHQNGGVIVKLRIPLEKQSDDSFLEQYID